MNEETKNNRRAIAAGFFLATFVAGLAASGLFYFQRAYAGKIYPNVYLGERNLSGLTRKQAYFMLENEFNSLLNQEIVLKAGDKEVATTFAQTGISFDVNKTIQDAYNIGRADNFSSGLVASSQTLWKKASLSAQPKVNQNKYEAFINLIIPPLNPRDPSPSKSTGSGWHEKEEESRRHK